MKQILDRLVSPEGQQRIIAAIQVAERRTTGQIKVHVEGRCAGDALVRAQDLFVKLGLTATERHNGVLIYVAVSDHKFAILGDSGIHAVVGVPFWDAAASAMREAFVRGALGEGLESAVVAVGVELEKNFPRRPDEPVSNELSDDISTTDT